MDFPDKTVFGQQMGKTVAWVVECRRRDSKSGRGGKGWSEYVGGGIEGIGFPQLGKYTSVIPTVH